MLFQNIFSFWAKKLEVLAKITGMVVKTAKYVPLESFEGKQFFLIELQTSSDFEMKKIGL